MLNYKQIGVFQFDRDLAESYDEYPSKGGLIIFLFGEVL